jgi:hypothetical protein
MTDSDHIQYRDRLRERIEREHRADTVWTALSVVAVVITAGLFLWMAGVMP